MIDRCFRNVFAYCIFNGHSHGDDDSTKPLLNALFDMTKKTSDQSDLSTFAEDLKSPTPFCFILG